MILKWIFFSFLIYSAKSQTLSSSGIKITTTTESTKVTFGPLSSSGLTGSTLATVTQTSSVTNSITDCPIEVKAACLNGSTCVLVGPYTFKCICRTGFSGYDCGDSDSKLFCETAPCKNGSTCLQINLTTGFCFCPPTHTGTYCETIL